MTASERRASAASRIDMNTCHAARVFVELHDPYGELEPGPWFECIGREWFVYDPDERVWITDDDVRELYGDATDEQWRSLLGKASARRARAASKRNVDPDTWDGDLNDLVGREEQLGHDAAACDATFFSRHEAFRAGMFLAEHRVANVGVDRDCGPQFSYEGRLDALALIETLAWGDTSASIAMVEEVVQRAMEATVDEFRLWQEGLDGGGALDEFSLSRDDVANLTTQGRLAYVAQLLRTLARCYGIRYDEDRAAVTFSGSYPHSLAWLLHELDAIVGLCLPGPTPGSSTKPASSGGES